MKKLTLTVITLLSLATPVRSQELSKYTALNSAINMWGYSFCNAVALGATRKEAVKGAFDDSFLYLRGLIGDDAALDLWLAMDKVRFLDAIINAASSTCPSEFVGEFGGNTAEQGVVLPLPNSDPR